MRPVLRWTVWACASAAACALTLGAARPRGREVTPTVVTLDGVLDPNTDDTPAFTPDGATAFFDRTVAHNKVILVSHRVHGHWTPADLYVFKVPSLRNVEKTGPYFHDGAVASLPEAVRLMGHHQLGRDLAPADVEAIVAWLKSTTGELPLRYIAFPQKPD